MVIGATLSPFACAYATPVLLKCKLDIARLYALSDSPMRRHTSEFDPSAREAIVIRKPSGNDAQRNMPAAVDGQDSGETDYHRNRLPDSREWAPQPSG